MLAIGLTALVVTWRAPSYAQLRSKTIQCAGDASAQSWESCCNRSAAAETDEKWQLVWWNSDPHLAKQKVMQSCANQLSQHKMRYAALQSFSIALFPGRAEP